MADHGLPRTPWRHQWEPILDLLDRLETVKIEATASYDGTCPKCKGPFWGFFDQKKASEYGVPMGTKWTVVPNFRDYILEYPGFYRHSRTPWGAIAQGNLNYRFKRSTYEVRMHIVRSGVFTREQLRGALFTEHELEVNDLAFRTVRPKVCDCSYGEPTDDAMASFLAEAGISPEDLWDHPLETEVDSKFIAQGPVRTGHRRRSESARMRRHAKKVRGPITGHEPVLVTKVIERGTVVPKLRRNRLTPRQLGRKERKPYRKSYPDIVPNHKGHQKYWYFLRKRGLYYVSIHSPVHGQGKLLAMANGLAQSNR